MTTEDISKPHTTCKQSIEKKVGWKIQTKVVFQISNFALCHPSLNSHQDPKKDLHGGEKQPIIRGVSSGARAWFRYGLTHLIVE